MALARVVFEALNINYRHSSAGDAQYPMVLERLERVRNRRPVRTEHQTKQFMRHRKRCAVRPIVHFQQPARQALLDSMHAVTYGCLRNRR
jgi:hypothetical protein